MDFLRILIEQDHAWAAAINNAVNAHAGLARFAQFCAEWLIIGMGILVAGSALWGVTLRETRARAQTAKERSWLFPSGMPPPARTVAAETAVRRWDFFPAMVAMSAAGAGYVIRTMAGTLIARARPYQSGETVALLIGGASGHSFPSGHATVAFALACGIAPDRPVLGMVLLGCAILIAAGRVMVGVHYPLDVAAGAVLGAGMAWLIRQLLKRWRGRFQLSKTL